MALDDIIKLQLKKVNPFQGLIIDADTWRDAHNYHRDQQRLHVLAFHGTGIVQGLEVNAASPPDLSVVVSPGMGIDPEGNVIIVPQKQRYRLQAQRGGPVYLVIQFREVPTEPYQPPNGGQPTRLLDAYRIQERDKLPAEPYLELARIDFDPGRGAIREGGNGKNEIDLRFRKAAAAPAPAPALAAPAAAAAAAPVVREVPVAAPVATLVWGHAVLGDADRATHLDGLKNLARAVAVPGQLEITVQENVALGRDIERCALLYLTGRGRFELSAEQQSALGRYLQAGGAIVGEGCADGEGQAKAAREFGLAFNQLASQVKRKLETVKRGHPLLTIPSVFADVPAGAETGMLLEGGYMVYSGSDYGCAWQGGHQNQPLAREAIRAAFELGTNIAAYASQRGAR